MGTAMLSTVYPAWLRFGTFVVLLPLILVQAAGWRRPIQAERAVGLVFGGGLGVAFGLSRLLQELELVQSSAAYLVLVATAVLAPQANLNTN